MADFSDDALAAEQQQHNVTAETSKPRTLATKHNLPDQQHLVPGYISGTVLFKYAVECKGRVPATGWRGSPEYSAEGPEAGRQVHKARSWYGSLSRKSQASTQVAKETILGGTMKPSSTPDFSRFDTKKSIDTVNFDPPDHSTTTLPNIPETATDAPKEESKAKLPQESSMSGDSQKKSDDGNTENGKPAMNSVQAEHPSAEASQPPPTASTSWLTWFARPSTATEAKAPEAEAAPQEAPKESVQPQQPPAEPMQIDTRTPPAVEHPESASGSYWFSFWQSATVAATNPSQAPEPTEQPSVTSEAPKEPEDAVMQDAPPPPKPDPSPQPSAGSTWAFWSRDTPKKSPGKPDQVQEPGELAVIGDGSETHPKRASQIEVNEPSSKASSVKDGKGKDIQPKAKAPKKTKRVRPQSMEIDEALPIRPETPKSDTSSLKGESSTKAGAKTPIATKTLPSNLLLPSFGSTYRMKENPSILKQITQLLLRTRQSPAKHVFLAREPPKLKKAVAIGVHGLFPATYLRPMIGQPTGTSIKFANHCADAVRRWADSHGCEDCEIEKVALEGEGKIGERVENLWKLLLNWIEHIRKADLIMLACHSQGVPVTIMLVAKLIELGIITTAKIGVCAMAGVSLGPFPDYKSGMGMLMGSAAELWDFANSESEVSKRYENSLKVILGYGVRVTYIGSIDDQVVPMESAVYSPANHPYIYRAVFIDGRIHAPDFIAHLVGFALKLRNLGISDHGLIRELSISLAGSLYGGEGHSRFLAVTHCLETSNVGNLPCDIQKYEGLANPNPYHLPWIMRGLLEEDFVKTELTAETTELVKQFDDWKPVTKALKDVKYRLEAVRSKL
ncbi:hypothetical protein UCRPA7_5321 [Phaeoacremonium minimum UCRPA7]|uniref:YMC020W-like alpha/beta hydrolase domain-containing protein n=1 Tax=Phaeoacremonium minimum (strain UCR-PA7) TaxID=1286976 RepID=R8BIE8_PHAM7|nr:hypothetical protein UCRPA7_5321 [Phaeoacremonium minimum UCRPA7]EON99100.1 hypothetical protein UCRPA7_5321 [Phaeoacremonium minimum UCRPA7]